MDVVDVALNDPRVEPYRDLKTRKHAASQSGLFIAEGRFVVERLLESSFQPHSLLVAARRLGDVAPLVPEGVPIYRVPDQDIHELVGYHFHSGILGAGYRPDPVVQWDSWCRHLAETPGRPSTVVVCPETRNPDNLGSLMRSCAALGAAAVILGPESADAYSRRAIRVSSGAIFTCPVMAVPDLGATLDGLHHQHGFSLVGTVLSPQSVPLTGFRRPGDRVALLVGSEDAGLQTPWQARCQHLLRIPMAQQVDSLNVAVATAVVLWALRSEESAS